MSTNRVSQICSGLGNCHCGECICDQTEHGVPKIATTEGEACDCELASDKCYNPDPDPGKKGDISSI